MNKENFSELINFVSKKTGVDAKLIKRDTTIEDDLGVTGDDALEFIVEYGKEFNVDVSKFKAAHYFDGEGFSINIISFVMNLFNRKRVAGNIKKKQLTIEDLIKGIRMGYII